MELKIEDIGINGEGIARIEYDKGKKVCFVNGALTDEIVEVDVVKTKSKFCVANVNNIKIQSSERVVPKCKYFGVCGGCDIQHMSEDLQKKFKKAKVEQTLKKIGNINIGISDTIKVNGFNYRNKMVFQFSQQKDKLILGMYKKESKDIVDIDKCLLTSENINKILSLSKEYFSCNNYNAYNYYTKNGDLKYLVIREYDNQFLITIVATKKLDLKEYYRSVSTSFKHVGVSLIISDKDDDILSGRYMKLFGLECLQIEEFGIKYKVDNRSFLQVNNEIKKIIYEKVLSEVCDSDKVIDCYSGSGVLSAMIAKKCKTVIGIEINKSASDSAKLLAKENNIDNIKYICGDVRDYINLLNSDENITIVLDPPRAGCESSVMRAINNSNIDKVIYISCDPATLSRDLKLISENYTIKYILPIDMFPQTKHIETLVCLHRGN